MKATYDQDRYDYETSRVADPNASGRKSGALEDEEKAQRAEPAMEKPSRKEVGGSSVKHRRGESAAQKQIEDERRKAGAARARETVLKPSR
jgi:hypothetical protein